jgi:release factor glutamine methyltransferase
MNRPLTQGVRPEPTIGAKRRALTALLRAGGIETPELDARVLVGHALQLDHAQLSAQSARTLRSDEIEAISTLAARRLNGEPIARIVGAKEFWGMPLRLSGDTLVPRPETETVVEAALSAMSAERARERLLFADFGTGSGALLLALLSEWAQAFGIGTDRNARALVTARANAVQFGFADRAAFVACDYAAALSGPFDCIVCNPPYIASPDLATLPLEVRRHDPRLALDGGADGLDGYRAIAAAVPALLAPDGVLAVELGAGQAPAVAALFSAAGLALRPPRTDVHGVPRALLAMKPQAARA